MAVQKDGCIRIVTLLQYDGITCSVPILVMNRQIRGLDNGAQKKTLYVLLLDWSHLYCILGFGGPNVVTDEESTRLLPMI